MIYPEQRGDFFPKMWNTAEFDSQFDLLMDDEAFIATTEQGFVQLNLFEKIGQFVKTFFGGTDYSQKQRVQAAWLKFLYYGEAQGFLNDKHIERLRQRIKYPVQCVDPSIDEMFKKLSRYHNAQEYSCSDHLEDLREIVEAYHQKNAFNLRPGLWRRLLISPSIDIKKLVFFGDTPLCLCRKALQRKVPNIKLALNYLEEVFHLKNDSPDFQGKIAEQLEEIENDYPFELEKHKPTLQSLWIKLGQTAFENELPDDAHAYLLRALKCDSKNVKIRLQIGKVYLSNKEYDLANPFLSDLKKAFPQDLLLQIEIGHAYWQNKQFDQAIKAYETALSIFKKQSNKFALYHEQIASVQNQMGLAHLEKVITQGTPDQAISFFFQAVQLDTKALVYQENLCEAYAQEWQILDENFAAIYGQEWLKALNLLQASIVQKNKDQILSMLLDCSEHYFKMHQNQKAHVYLEKALILFKDDADAKTEALGLATQYGDWSPFKSRLEGWEKEHPTDPFLKEKIANAYWSSDKNKALKLYQISLDLFEHSLSRCTDDDEILDCEQHIADVQARIGQTHLQAKPRFWTGIPYDEAIKSLEKAKSLDPKRYTPLLFEACLSAAQAEKEKLWSDKTKIITYYYKAFEVSPQKGDYLIELFQLCLDHQKQDIAIAVYKKIQQESWVDEIDLPATIYSGLALKLFEQKDYDTALKCLKQAYEIDPNNQQYQQEYFQLNLTLADRDLKKLQTASKKTDNEVIESLLPIAQDLETCWKEGADKIKKFEKPYQDILTKVYGYLAERYVQCCALPKPAKEMYKGDVQKHKEIHEKEIQQALYCYDKALSFQPDNAALHFDKGLLLDWIIEFEKARIEFELAVQYQPRNPFYHKLLAPLCVILSPFNLEKKEEHDKLTKQYASPTFNQDYETWSYEFMSQGRQSIDPHSYTLKKGWFG